MPQQTPQASYKMPIALAQMKNCLGLRQSSLLQGNSLLGSAATQAAVAEAAAAAAAAAAAGASATELGCAWQLIQSCKTGTPASPTPRFVVCRPAHDTTPGSSAQGPLLPGVSQSSSPAPRAAGYHLSRTSGTTPPRQPPPSLSSLWMYSPQAASADVAPAGPGCRSTSPVRTGSDSVGPVVPPLLRAVPTPMGRSAQSSDRLWTPTPPTGSRPQAVTSASASVPLSQGRLWVHPPAI